MEINREKIVIGLSTALVFFSAGLISYSGLSILSAQPKENIVNTDNTVSTSFKTTNQVLGVNSSEDSQIPETTNANPVKNNPVTAQVPVAPPTITQSTQYINTTRTPLEEIKPKHFYFTSVATDISQYNFRVKYLDGSYSAYTKIEGFDNMMGDSFSAIRASSIYTFEQPFTDIEVESNPGDIAVTFTEDPNNVMTSAAYNVSYTYERDYKNALFNNFGINITTREEWGAPSYSEWIPDFSKVNRIVVHHTATANSGNPLNAVQSIYNDHRMRCSDNSGYYPSNCSLENTWSDIGYNYLIDINGNVYEGRSGGNGSIGAHAIPNSGAIGIALVGNYSTAAPSTAMLNSLTNLVGALSFLNDFKVQWQTTVFGHRNYLNTECPGNNVYNILPQLSINAENTRLAYQNGTFPGVPRDLHGKLSFGQRFVRSNPSITADGTSHIYIIADNITQEMKDKLKGTSNWSGAYGTEIYGDNVVAFVPENLAPAFVGELSIAIPNLQFSTELP